MNHYQHHTNNMSSFLHKNNLQMSTLTIWRHVLRSLDCKSTETLGCQFPHSSECRHKPALCQLITLCLVTASQLIVLYTKLTKLTCSKY